MSVDPASIGQDKPNKSSDEAYDKAHGTYKEQVIEGADKLQESTMPKGADPSPFRLGPLK